MMLPILGIIAFLAAIASLAEPHLAIPGFALLTTFGVIAHINGVGNAITTFAILFGLLVVFTAIDEYEARKENKQSN